MKLQILKYINLFIAFKLGMNDGCDTPLHALP